MYAHWQPGHVCTFSSMGSEHPSDDVVAPELPCPHRNVEQHLKDVPWLGKHLRAVVEKHATIARVRHSVIATISKQLKTPTSSNISLGKILSCVRLCKDNDVVPPAFLVDFREGILQKWASEIIIKVRKDGGRQWSLVDREALVWSLGNCLDAGMCHRQHVSVVDQGRNPSWLAEYVRCVRLIWHENGGKSTPETMQYLRKLGCCTCECVTLIAEYATLCLNGTKAVQVYRDLSRMQRVVFSSYTTGGISNAAATECIQQLTIEPPVLEWLVKVEDLLTDIWDTITNPHGDEGCCLAVPGIKGSHVEQLMLPSKVVTHGTPALIRNCINSALPLCLLNPEANHNVSMHSAHPCIKKMRNGVVSCVHSMLEACPFRANGACDPLWLDTYLDMTRAVFTKVCQDLGVFEDDRAQTTTSAACEIDHFPGIPMSTVVERDAYMKSEVRKVQIAGNMFDATVLNIKHWKAGKTTRIKEFSAVWDTNISGYKNDLSVAGRVLSDLNRIVSTLDLSTDILINIEEKSVSYISEAAATQFLGLLIEYMREFSKSRRRRKDALLLKRNARPEEDKRRGWKKRARADSPQKTAD